MFHTSAAFFPAPWPQPPPGLPPRGPELPLPCSQHPWTKPQPGIPVSAWNLRSHLLAAPSLTLFSHKLEKLSVPQTCHAFPASGPLHRLFPLPETLLPHITHAHSLSSPRPLLKHRHLSGPLLIPYLKLYPPLPPHSLFYFPPQHSSPSHRPRNSLSIWAVVLVQSVFHRQGCLSVSFPAVAPVSTHSSCLINT